jgi:hypothetical protein
MRLVMVSQKTRQLKMQNTASKFTNRGHGTRESLHKFQIHSQLG